MVVVSILAGGALFVSGFLVGQRTRRSSRARPSRPGRPVPAVLGHATTRSSSASPAATTTSRPRPRRDQGHGRLARRPVLGLPDARAVPPGPPGPVRPVRGDRRRDRDAGREGRRRPTARRSAPTASSSSSRPIEGSPSEKAGIKAGDAIVAVDGAALDGLTVDAAREQGPRQEGHRGRPSIVRGSAAPIDITVVRDVIVQKEVIDEGPRRTARSATSRSPASRTTPRAKFHDALQADLKAGKKKIILDLRGNPGGYVTAARRIAQRVHRGRADLLGAGRRRAARSRPTRPAGGIATDRHDPARRPRRQGQRLGERDRGRRAPGPEAGDSSSARRRSARAPSSSGSSSRTARRAEADDREVADAGQALDPPRRDHPGRRGRDAGRRRPRPGPGPRQGGRAADEGGGRPSTGAVDAGARRVRTSAVLLRVTAFLYGDRERKEVMCSDRQ